MLIFAGQKRLGFEFKFSDAPNLTKSMQISLTDLALDELIVIYPGKKDYRLTEQIFVRGLAGYLEAI